MFDLQTLQLVSITPDTTPDEVGSGKTSPDFDKRREVLILRLQSILARFVSDYRGIFAIEVKCAGAIK